MGYIQYSALRTPYFGNFTFAPPTPQSRHARLAVSLSVRKTLRSPSHAFRLQPLLPRHSQLCVPLGSSALQPPPTPDSQTTPPIPVIINSRSVGPAPPPCLRSTSNRRLQPAVTWSSIAIITSRPTARRRTIVYSSPSLV